MQEMVQGGSFDGLGGSWNYGLDVRAGQRYMVELRAGTDWPISGLRLATFDGVQGMQYLDAFSFQSISGVTRLVFTAEQDGLQNISANGWGAYGERVDFELVAREIAADDHADLASGASLLGTGQALAGELDWAGDVDFFRMNLKAGQPYRLKLQADGPAPLPAGRLQLAGSDTVVVEGYFEANDRTSSDTCDLLFTPAVDGVYTLQVDSPFVVPVGSYRLSLDTRIRDDHGDLPSQASGLVLGHSEQGRIDGLGDADCFSIVAQAGQRIAVSLRPVDALSGMNLSVSLAGAADGLGGYGMSSGQGPQIIFTAPADGAYVVRAEGAPGRGWAGDLYRIDAQVLSPDDAPDTSGGVALLQGHPARGVLDAVADVDRFSAWLQAGQRYRAVLVDEGGPGASPEANHLWIFASGADGADGHGGVLHATGEQSIVLQAASNGRYDFSVMGWGDLDRPGARYQLQLEPIAADDHPDSSALATALPINIGMAGQLDTPDDVDYFAFPVKAGQPYQLELQRPVEGGESGSLYGVMPRLELSLQDARYLVSSSQYEWVDKTAPSGFEGALGNWWLLPDHDGTVLARVSAPLQYAELDYTLRLQPVESDGPLHGHDRDGGALQLGGASELGRVIDGTPGNDSLQGSPLDDRLRGGEGKDVLSGGGGRDLLLGGGGIDTVIIPVSLYEATLMPQSTANGWAATDRDSWHVSAPMANPAGAAETGMLTLRGVERLQFTDAFLALDMDGHAGTVARLLTVLYGADVGPYDRGNAGMGLAWLDAGRSAESLAAAAVADWAFSTMAGSVELIDQWLWVCRNAGGDPEHQGQLFSHGVDALMQGQPLAGLVVEAAQSLGVTQQLELMGLPQTGLSYEPAPLPVG